MREKIAIGPNTTIKEAAYRIIATGQPGLPVVNKNSEVIGILTEFNILGAIKEGMDLDTTTAERLMAKEPTVAEVNTSVSDLIQMMLLENFTIVPIVHNKKYAGIVSRNMIMDAYLSPEYYLLLSK
jgi:CBS domain-containing protein